MATESSAVVRIARLAQQRPLRLPSEVRERTVIVRVPGRPTRWWLWLIAALVVAAAAVSLASLESEGEGFARPVAEPLIEGPVVATPLPEGPTASAAVAGTDDDSRESGEETESDSAGLPSEGDAREGGDVRSAGQHGEERLDESSGHSRRRSQVVGFGTLQIGSKPPCRIYIDGRRTGLSTPQRNIRLRPGRHIIRLKNRDVGIDERFGVRIRDGRTTKVIRDMSDRL